MFSICRFRALIQAIPRPLFDRLVAHHQADRYGHHFRSWHQLQAMIFLQLSGLSSLRTVEAAFNGQRRHHYHWGSGPLRRSTLSDANRRCHPALYADLAGWLMTQAHRRLRREGRELLYLLDSTSMTLRGPGFDDWTRPNRTSHTQGLKLHVLYDAHEQVPAFHSITPPNVNDIDQGKRLPVEPGALYVFDKAYCDYDWWYWIDQQGATFVTRFKRNAGLRTLQSRSIAPQEAATILADEVVRLAHTHSRGGHRHGYRQPLRRIAVARPGRAALVLATNDLVSPASVIAQHYRARWGVELFFKWIKQHLNVRRFIGRSANAVKLQILTALITYLLLMLAHQASGTHLSLWLFLAQLRGSLFERIPPQPRPRPPPLRTSRDDPTGERWTSSGQ
jgi:putative transposase